jgi:hypothetical protein
MKGISALSILSWLAFSVAVQTVGADETLEKNPSVPGGHIFTWWGEPGWTYFLQYSDDAESWSYFPSVIEAGTGATHQCPFIAPGPRKFIRFRATDQPTDDPENADFDSDQVSNILELGAGTDPLRWLDLDSDSLPDDWESFYLIDDPDADSDSDGLSNLFEFSISATSPTSADSDDDGDSDIYEYSVGTDPMDDTNGIATTGGTGLAVYTPSG